MIGGRLLGDGIDSPVDEALSNFDDNEIEYDPVTNTWDKAHANAHSSGVVLASATRLEMTSHVIGGSKVLRAQF